MRDLALHLIDILENSAKAGASRVDVTLCDNEGRIMMRVADNGPGLPPIVRDDPSDPFLTTRTERKVGLGLALLRQSAEQAGGNFRIEEPSGGGVVVICAFDRNHIDAKPLGDIAGALLTALLSWPSLRLVLHIGDDTQGTVFDSDAVRAALDDVPLDHPKVLSFVREQLEQALLPLGD